MKLAAVLPSLILGTILVFVAGCSPSTVKAAPLSANYVAAQEALSADNFDQAKTALSALAAESTGDFHKEIIAAASAADIDSMRVAFRSASDVLIKNGVPAEYAVAYCPMYKGGASWIQKKGPIDNPYMGQKMLTCGEFKQK